MKVTILNPEETTRLFEYWGKASCVCYDTKTETPEKVGKGCMNSGHFSGSRGRYILFKVEGCPRFTIDQAVRHDIGVMKNVQSFRYVSKDSFVYETLEEKIYFTIIGNIYKGSYLKVEEERFEIWSKTIWYEYILAIIPFILILIWGNSVSLCSIIPVVGGAIGGGVSGLLGFTSLIVMKNIKNPIYKILIGLGMIAATFIVCAVIASVMIGSLA